MLTAIARGDATTVELPMLMMKLFGTEPAAGDRGARLDLIGSAALLEPTEPRATADRDRHVRGTLASCAYMCALAVAIAGGASNIQRNIIGERGLGLPRDLHARK